MRLPTGTETVLLVDDEPSIRRLIARVLAGLGYDVLEARTGHEAVEIAGSHAAPLHLLVSDARMPEMNGFELAERVTELHSEARVLIVSGHSDNFEVRQGLRQTPHATLLKPFTHAALTHKIRGVLDAPAPVR